MAEGDYVVGRAMAPAGYEEMVGAYFRELAREDLIPAHDLELARDEYEYLQERRELALESQKVELEFRRAQVDALQASLRRMEDNLTIVKEKQDNLTIRAPITGHLTALAEEGVPRAGIDADSVDRRGEWSAPVVDSVRDIFEPELAHWGYDE